MDAVTALKISGVVIVLMTVYLVVVVVVHKVVGKPIRLNPYYRPSYDIWLLGGLFHWAARRDAGYRCRNCGALITPTERRLGLYDLRNHLCERCFSHALNPRTEKGVGS